MMEEALADFMKLQREEVKKEIDNVSRIGNAFMKRTNLPREIHLRTFRQGFKEELLQRCKNKTLKVQDQEIKVLKEVPWRVRGKKKEYQKLTTCLRNNQIQYKWLIPEGVSFKFQGTIFKLNSTMKAEDFLRRNKNLQQEQEEEEEKEESDSEDTEGKNKWEKLAKLKREKAKRERKKAQTKTEVSDRELRPPRK